jgi:anti-anti-sigma regulatory factor
MPFELERGDGAWTLHLTGVVDIFDVAGLHTAVVEAPERTPAGGLAVRLDGAESVDTAVTQVLMALGCALGEAGKPFRVEGAPRAVAERWRVAGLAEALRV